MHSFAQWAFMACILLITSQGFAESDVTLQADKLVWDAERTTLSGDGNVRIVYEGNWITADQASYNSETELIEARGNVLWGGEQGSGKGDFFSIDVETRTGYMLEAEITDNAGTRAWGERIEQVAPKTYVVYEGGFTPCDCPTPTASGWKVTVSRAKIKWRDWVAFANGFFWAKDIPILYVPGGYLPLLKKRKTGFLFPLLSYSARYGFTAEPGFFLTLGPSADLTTWVEYTTLGGWGATTEFRSKTRTGSEQFKFNFFDEASDAPYLTAEARDARTRWQLTAKVDETPWDLFRLGLNVNYLSDDTYESDFASSLADLTKTTAKSDLTISREFSGYASGIARVSATQALLGTTTTGSRAPNIWLRSDPLSFANLPIWLNLDGRYDRFYSYNNDLGDPWNPTAFDRQGHRLFGQAEVGAHIDPLPGLHTEAKAGGYGILRYRDLYTEVQDANDSSILHVTQTVVDVGGHVNFYVQHQTYWGVKFQNDYGLTMVRPGYELLWVKGQDTAQLPIEDLDAIASQLWFVPKFEALGDIAQVVDWQFEYRYPYVIESQAWIPLKQHVFDVGIDSKYVSFDAQTTFRPQRAQQTSLMRADASIQITPAKGHKITFGYAMQASDITTISWDAGRPSPYADDALSTEPYHEFLLSYNWTFYRFFGALTARRRLPLPGIDEPAWVERIFKIGYKDPCDCWSASVQVKDLPGTKADRVDVRVDLALIGGASSDPL